MFPLPGILPYVATRHLPPGGTPTMTYNDRLGAQYLRLRGAPVFGNLSFMFSYQDEPCNEEDMSRNRRMMKLTCYDTRWVNMAYN